MCMSLWCKRIWYNNYYAFNDLNFYVLRSLANNIIACFFLHSFEC